MSFVHFHPRDALSVTGKVSPLSAEALRELRARIGPDFAFDGRNPYARLFMRTLSYEYGAFVFDICSATDWVGAFCAPLGDYELVAASPFEPRDGTVLADDYRASNIHVVRSAEEAFDAIYPAFEAWCELGEVQTGQEK